MKIPAGITKYGVALLGVVCAFLIANLVAQYRAMQPGQTHVNPSTASTSRAASQKDDPHVADDLVGYDPEVHFVPLKKLDSRPLPDEDRNPFEYVGGAPPPSLQGSKPLPPPPPAAPPLPPPPPLKALGYNELPGGKKSAMVTYNDDMEMVQEGDMIGGRFKVIKISPSTVVVYDGNTKSNLELPIPQ